MGMTVKELTKKMKKDGTPKLPVAIYLDGQYYDIDRVEVIWVKKEKDWGNDNCYGISDEESPESFPILALS